MSLHLKMPNVTLLVPPVSTATTLSPASARANAEMGQLILRQQLMLTLKFAIRQLVLLDLFVTQTALLVLEEPRQVEESAPVQPINTTMQAHAQTVVPNAEMGQLILRQQLMLTLKFAIRQLVLLDLFVTQTALLVYLTTTLIHLVYAFLIAETRSLTLQGLRPASSQRPSRAILAAIQLLASQSQVTPALSTT